MKASYVVNIVSILQFSVTLVAILREVCYKWWMLQLITKDCEPVHRRKTPNFKKDIKIKVKWSRYRPGVTQRVGRGIALLFHDRGTRRGWVVSPTHRPHFTLRKDPVPILQEAGWAPWPFWTGGKSRPHRDSIPDRPARSQSLYRLSYRAHLKKTY